jgi:hypothetical protein
MSTQLKRGKEPGIFSSFLRQKKIPPKPTRDQGRIEKKRRREILQAKASVRSRSIYLFFLTIRYLSLERLATGED